MQSTKLLVLYHVHAGLSCWQAQKTQFIFSNFFFFFKNHANSEIWKKFAEAHRPQMTIRCKCIAC